LSTKISNKKRFWNCKKKLNEICENLEVENVIAHLHLNVYKV